MNRKIKMKRLPPSAMPLGSLFACQDCPPDQHAFDATRAVYHSQSTGHRLTLLVQVREP